MQSRGLAAALFLCLAAFAETPPAIRLTVRAGVPLRLYLTKGISKRAGVPVNAKVLEPVYAFDREVIPAGARVIGSVSSVRPVSGKERARAILNGDFTPLHVALVQFTTLIMPDGRQIALHTAPTPGLNMIANLHPPKPKKDPPKPAPTGVLAKGKRYVSDTVHAQVDRVRSIPQIVRGPDKKEIVTDYLESKLPYHPQHVRKGTRFDAELTQPLEFGTEQVPRTALALVGDQPAPDTVAHARLVTPLESGVSKTGQPVEAVLTEPVFSAAHKLLLPEGTHLSGKVAVTQKARRFRRSGRLRFTLQSYELPPDAVKLLASSAASTARPAQKALIHRTQVTLAAAEGAGKSPLKVNSEGTVQVQQSKMRFLAAAGSVMVARRAGDNDPIRNQNTGAVIGQNANVGGRTIGGGFGFGLIGAGIAQSSRWVGAGFGYYGLAWALYSTLLARGPEVQFGKNAVIDVRFDARAPAAGAK